MKKTVKGVWYAIGLLLFLIYITTALAAILAKPAPSSSQLIEVVVPAVLFLSWCAVALWRHNPRARG